MKNKSLVVGFVDTSDTVVVLLLMHRCPSWTANLQTIWQQREVPYTFLVAATLMCTAAALSATMRPMAVG
jgi:hypothetical protein